MPVSLKPVSSTIIKRGKSGFSYALLYFILLYHIKNVRKLLLLSQLGRTKPTRTTNWPSGKLQGVPGFSVHRLCCPQYYTGVTGRPQSCHLVTPYRPKTEPQPQLRLALLNPLPVQSPDMSLHGGLHGPNRQEKWTIPCSLSTPYKEH